jgi:hypothetical protein
MSKINELAANILDEKEALLAEHLAFLLGDDKWDTRPLVEEIIPIYWEKDGDRLRNPRPWTIYRPLNYIVVWSGLGDFKNWTRAYLDVISAHLEGCLQNLLPSPTEYRITPLEFGKAVFQLRKQGILSNELATKLFAFNSTINIPSKHFGAYMRTTWLDERTF